MQTNPPPVGGSARTWRQAMSEALYGAQGFYRRTGAAAHFRTSPLASPLFAGAVRALASDVDTALHHPDPFDVVDVGAGGGELLEVLAAGVSARWRLTAVELRPGEHARLDWRPDLPACTGLLIANEWLDTVPCEVVQRTADGVRLVLEDGSLGPAPGTPEMRWLARWWPLRRIGDLAEVGRPRDEAWAAAVGRLRRGVAVAVDYDHVRTARPSRGTLSGYRRGRQVTPVADGSCDLTAHVALDACAAAAEAAHPDSVRASLLTTQRRALRALGLDATPVPAYAGDPMAHLRALADAGQVAELLDPAGLGGFGWLAQSVGAGPPPLLAEVTTLLR